MSRESGTGVKAGSGFLPSGIGLKDAENVVQHTCCVLGVCRLVGNYSWMWVAVCGNVFDVVAASLPRD